MTNITASWVAPVVDSNNNPYDAASLLAYYDLQAQAPGATDFTSVGSFTGLTASFTVTAIGTYNFQLFAVGNNGNRSAPATGSVVVVDQSTPGAPTNFTVSLA